MRRDEYREGGPGVALDAPTHQNKQEVVAGGSAAEDTA